MEEVAAIQKPIVETKPYNDERESESKSCPSLSIPPATLFGTCMAKTGNILRIPLSVGLDGDTGKGSVGTRGRRSLSISWRTSFIFSVEREYERVNEEGRGHLAKVVPVMAPSILRIGEIVQG